MELVDEKNESFDDVKKTYDKAKEILRKHPDIRGFQGSAGNDKLLLEKKPLTDGMNLGVKGYEKMTVKQGPERGYSSSATRW